MLASATTSFFLATTNAETCRTFYRDTLGLTLVSDDDFAVVFDLAGSELRISKVPAFTPHPFTVLDWQVPDIGAAHSMLTGKGVEPLIFEGMDHDERGVWTVPGAPVQILWFKDPDGNVLSVSQRG